MNKSRRSFLGLGAALTGAFAAGKAVASPPVAVPEYKPIVGELRQVFCYWGTEPEIPGMLYGPSKAVAVSKYVRWNGSNWVDA